MPLTLLGKRDLEALHPDPVALSNGRRLHEQAEARRAAWALKNPEQAERDRLSIEEHDANRSAAIAEGNGPLFDSLCGENGNDTDRAERDRLYWAVYALGQRTEQSKIAA